MREEAYTLASADLFLDIGVIMLVVLLLQMWLPPMSLRELDPRHAWRRLRGAPTRNRKSAATTAPALDAPVEEPG